MSAYLFYTIEKEEEIKLANEFNEFRKRIQNEYITLDDFIEYANMYFKAISKKMVGFDYDLYGSVLLNAKVVYSNNNDVNEYHRIIKEIYIYLHKYNAYRRNHTNNEIDNYQCIKFINTINNEENSKLDKGIAYEKKI